MRKMFGSIQKKNEFMRSPENLNTKRASQSQKTIDHPTNFNSSSHQSKSQQSVNQITQNASPISIQEQKKNKLGETNHEKPRFMAKIQPQQQENIGKQYLQQADNQQPNPPSQAIGKIRVIRTISQPVPPNINIQLKENGLNNNKKDFSKSSQQQVPLQKDQNTNDEQIYRLNQINPKIIVKSTNGRYVQPSNQNKQKNYYQPKQQNILQLTQTILKTQKSSCFHCNQQIETNFLQLQCYHFYHIECIQEFIQSQVYQANFQGVQCHCGKSIGQKSITQICDKLLPIIFAKQIEIIKQKYDKYLLICSFCQFFCIYNLERSMDSFCPNCLIRISQRQAWRKK